MVVRLLLLGFLLGTSLNWLTGCSRETPATAALTSAGPAPADPVQSTLIVASAAGVAAQAPAGPNTTLSPDSLPAVLPPDHPFATCAACHGPEGEGSRELNSPRLVGQDPIYLEHQIESFRRGFRGSHPEDIPGQQMRAIALANPPEVFERAIAWVVEQEPKGRPDRIFGDRRRGEMLYQQSCAVCHGDTGQGDGLYHMARLSQQHGWYLAAQLRAYREGKRGVNPADELGTAMRFYAELLPDEQAIEDVVAWLLRQHSSSAGEKRK